jgi:phage anti-repressor protein
VVGAVLTGGCAIRIFSKDVAMLRKTARGRKGKWEKIKKRTKLPFFQISTKNHFRFRSQ